MDASILKKLVKDSECLELDSHALEQLGPILDSISSGLVSISEEIKIPMETEPCFMRIDRPEAKK